MKLSAPRNRYFEELLGGEAECMLLIYRRDVVEPVEIGQGLQIVLVLYELLGPAMEQADMRIDALDDLAIEFKHEPQDTMRGRMLRSEIDGEVANCGLGHGNPSGLVVRCRSRMPDAKCGA